MVYNTVIELSKDIKRKINEYNEAEPSKKKEEYEKLRTYIQDVLSVPKNRALIYKGDTTAVVFTKTLGKWRMKIWKDLTER